eukprot:CAMPEP_0170392064 /NCGR_PEP_ID=MMETSP0117_2-20130122/19994_1 /TAXON_ID=400756 /ORGANISM="Durinskia baltica, Strain CSIRO CS-38" /LENGTH=119 /DNA_ID=CAMNT_0010648179 /DNA_START=104 /DNA_END=463 /DNA_ORIENTATION=-
MAASIFLASLSMVCLAFVSSYGGESNSANFMVNFYDNRDAVNDDEQQNSYAALAGGYGFGAFMFCVAFCVFLSGAIYISPMFCGSPNEKKLISKPQEIDAGYASYTENPVQARPANEQV